MRNNKDNNINTLKPFAFPILSPFILKRLIGKGDILSEGEEVVIISLGHMSSIALDIKKRLLKNHINAMVIDPVFIKPLDTELLSHACEKAKLIVTIEEHSLNGGLGSIINHFILMVVFHPFCKQHVFGHLMYL